MRRLLAVLIFIPQACLAGLSTPRPIPAASRVAAPAAGLHHVPTISATPPPQALSGTPGNARLQAPIGALSKLTELPAQGASADQPQAQDAEGALAATFDNSRLSVMMAASEAVPFHKTGGLADVVDAVARKLVESDHRVSLFLPHYPNTPLNDSFARQNLMVPVRLGQRFEKASVISGRHKGVAVHLIDHEFFRREGAYGNAAGAYHDNDERFSFFSQAALAAASALGLKPDIIHVHDWQAALIPAILKLQPSDPALAAAKTVLSLHNMAFQGLFPYESALKAGFSPADFNHHKLEFHGQFGFLKSGIALSDKVTTVSRTYARQIQESAEFGMGLEGLLRHRSRDLHGIVNGIDQELWDPASDIVIKANYDSATVSQGKAQNKTRFQRDFGLNVDPAAPVFGVVSRLSHQKGIDLIAEVAPEIVRLGGQLIITGPGDADIVGWLKRLAERFPGSIFLNPAFSETFARHIYAASDFYLMPSRFEPCGLSQRMAQRYGSLPIVSATGGLVDTVSDWRREPDGDGLFMDSFSAAGLADAVGQAFRLYADKSAHERARQAAMLRDSSWEAAIDEYIALYRSLLSR